MKRLVLEIASQGLPFVGNLLERLLLTGLAIRAWGVAGFEYWSLAISFSSILAVLDSGCMMNFANKIIQKHGSGDSEGAQAVLHQSNFIFLLIGLAGLLISLVVAASPTLQSMFGVSAGRFQPQAFWTLLCLCAATSIRLMAMNLMAVYRTFLSFARGTTMFALIDVFRVLVASGAIMVGASIDRIALTYLITTIAGLAAIAGCDIERKFPGFGFRISFPRGGVLAGSFGMTLAFGLPLLPLAAIQQGPVLLLGGVAAAGSGVVATFVLLRTLSNLMKSVAFKAVNILAMEIGRRALSSKVAEAERLMAPASFVTAAIFGCMSGGILAYGAPALKLWTSHANLFDTTVMTVMLAPMVLLPSATLAQWVLQYQNRPRAWTVGVFFDLILAFLLWFLFPIPNPVLRVTCAVSAGEVLGLGVPVVAAVYHDTISSIFLRELRYIATSLACCAATLLACWSLVHLFPPSSTGNIAILAGATGVLYLTIMYIVLRRTLALARLAMQV